MPVKSRANQKSKHYWGYGVWAASEEDADLSAVKFLLFRGIAGRSIADIVIDRRDREISGSVNIAIPSYRLWVVQIDSVEHVVISSSDKRSSVARQVVICHMPRRACCEVRVTTCKRASSVNESRFVECPSYLSEG